MQRLLVTGLLLVVSGARADDLDAEVKRRVEHAVVLHKQGAFGAALDELKTAYALDPRPSLLYAMGQLYVRLGECQRAIFFYRRFLATKPTVDSEGLTRQAIEVCEKTPATIEATPRLPLEPPSAMPIPEPEPEPEPQRAPPPPPIITHTLAPWYADRTADALVGTGLISAVAAGFVFGSAQDIADSAASTKRAIAIVAGVGGVALIAAGVVHYVWSDVRDRVQITPGVDGTVTAQVRF